MNSGKARAYTRGIVPSVYELFIFPRKDLEVPEIMSIFAVLKYLCGTSMPPRKGGIYCTCHIRKQTPLGQ